MPEQSSEQMPSCPVTSSEALASGEAKDNELYSSWKQIKNVLEGQMQTLREQQSPASETLHATLQAMAKSIQECEILMEHYKQRWDVSCSTRAKLAELSAPEPEYLPACTGTKQDGSVCSFERNAPDAKFCGGCGSEFSYED